MNNNPKDAYSYRDAGFNRFFRRTINSNPGAVNLSSASVGGGQNQLNFDNVQVSGSLGDTLTVGKITLDGKAGRQSVFDDLQNEVLRLGELDDG